MSDKIHPMRFVHAFLQHVDECGIFDEFDPEENAMVTSDEMMDLINMAMEICPERIPADEAAERMRKLTDAERAAYIQEDESIIIDKRNDFALKMAHNKGATGILEQLVAAQERGDIEEAKKLMQLAKEFTEA